MVQLCYLCVFVLLAILAAVKLLKGSKNRRLPPCLPWLPVVGSIPFIGKPAELGSFFMGESKRRGQVFAFYAGTRYVVVLNDWRTIYEAFVKKGLHFADRIPFFVDSQHVNQELRGIAMCPYTNDFNKRRQMLLSILKDLGLGKSVIETRVNVELEQLVESILDLNGHPFDPRNQLYRFVNGIIMGFIFGRHFDCDTDPLVRQTNDLIKSVVASYGPDAEFFPVLRLLPNYRKRLNWTVSSHRDFFKLVDEYFDQSLKNGADCFVSFYIKSLGDVQESDLQELKFIIRDLLTAGSDTTLTATLWTLVLLANNPDWQRRLQDQIDDILGKPPNDRMPTMNDGRQLTYVEATILEILRLETMLPLGGTRRTLCNTEINGFFIPKGAATSVRNRSEIRAALLKCPAKENDGPRDNYFLWTQFPPGTALAGDVIPNIYQVHMDPETWREPTKFQPERFLDKDGQLINKDRIIPFSIGKRSCFGEILARQELFFIVTRLAHMFRICPPEGVSRIEVSRISGLVVHPSSFEIRMIARTPRDIPVSERDTT